jgi:hypothetical protein
VVGFRLQTVQITAGNALEEVGGENGAFGFNGGET